MCNGRGAKHEPKQYKVDKINEKDSKFRTKRPFWMVLVDFWE